MANEINATNINEAIDKLEAEAENIKPIDNVLAKAAKAYVKTAYKEQYEIECLGLVMSQDKWNGYDLLDAFKEGAKWQNKQVWHTQNDNPPQEGKKIIFLWGQSNNIKDLNEDVGRLRLIYGEKVICGWSRWHLEDVRLWAYIEDLLPESLVAL